MTNPCKVCGGTKRVLADEPRLDLTKGNPCPMPGCLPIMPPQPDPDDQPDIDREIRERDDERAYFDTHYRPNGG